MTGNDKAVALLRTAIAENGVLVGVLHEVLALDDPEALRQLLHELDANNADLHVALEELEYRPFPPYTGAAAGGAGGPISHQP